MSNLVSNMSNAGRNFSRITTANTNTRTTMINYDGPTTLAYSMDGTQTSIQRKNYRLRSAARLNELQKSKSDSIGKDQF
jgi:hypothetical protein